MFEQEGTLANLAVSIARHFGVTNLPNPSLPLADRLLEGFDGSVVLLLLDGLGKYNLEAALAPDGFFRSHVAGDFASVFPPTTVAATTAAHSGLFPAQSGWLGWTMYYPQVDNNVTVFLNTDDGGAPAADYFVAGRYAPYTAIADLINRAGGRARNLSAHEKEPVESLDAMADIIASGSAEGPRYYDCYWHEPDATMHLHGATGEKTIRQIRALESTIAKWPERFHNTLLLITADHGLIDIDGAVLEDYPDIADCLARLPSIEPRAVNLFAKPGRADELKRLFDEHFGDAFRLYSHSEVFEKRLFGPGPNIPWLDAAVGDFVAVSTGRLCFFNTRGQKDVMKGMHAGGTDEEKNLSLIAVRCE